MNLLPTIPGFFRVEIKAGSKTDLLRATAELKHLVGEMEFIAGQNHDEGTALVLACHKIRATSNKLRGIEK